MCLLGAEDYAIEILAVLVPPHLSSSVKVHLQRALMVPVMGVTVMLSLGLALTGISDLAPAGPPALRLPSLGADPLEAPAP